MAKKGIHVVHSQGEWKVKKEGALKASKIFKTKEEATTYGRKVGKQEKGELYVHNEDGTIRDRRSYGKDPCPPVDKK